MSYIDTGSEGQVCIFSHRKHGRVGRVREVETFTKCGRRIKGQARELDTKPPAASVCNWCRNANYRGGGIF